MTKPDWESTIAQYGDTHLICACRKPLLTHGTIQEEAVLYNLDAKAITAALEMFNRLADREVCAQFLTTELSGGQQVLLMISLALCSSATQILFLDLELSLDSERKHAVQKEIGKWQSLTKAVLMLNTT
jgi:ABC-type branched-subunit amino acid transport system ATPase component